MDSKDKAVCALCLFCGLALPWLLLVGGAIMARLGSTPAWEVAGVAMIVASFIVFMVVAAIARVSNRNRHAH